MMMIKYIKYMWNSFKNSDMASKLLTCSVVFLVMMTIFFFLQDIAEIFELLCGIFAMASVTSMGLALIMISLDDIKEYISKMKREVNKDIK